MTSSLDSRIREILELNSKSSLYTIESLEKLKSLRQDIKKGESTGDKIRDFVIANLGVISDETEKPYRDLEKRLKDRIGDQILLIKKEESIHGYPGIVTPKYISPEFIGIDTELKLGISINGFELDINKGEIILSKNDHVKKYKHSEWRPAKGPILINWYQFINLGNGIENRTTSTKSSSLNFKRSLTIHVGDEVENYFGKNGILDVSYVDALNLLGLESPEKFKNKYKDKIYQDKVEILGNLETLTEKELKLNEGIKSIYDSIKSGSFIKNGAITVVEDEDDAKIVSIRAREILKETKQNIQDYLRKAVKLNMNQDVLFIEKKPGVFIDSRDYISKMCEKYQVEIPR